MHGVEKEVFETTFFFDRTLWEMALTMDERIEKDSSIYPNRLKHYKEIYIGHTPTTNFNRDLPMQAVNVWNIDTGAAFKGKLSGVDVNTKEVENNEAKGERKTLDTRCEMEMVVERAFADCNLNKDGALR